MGRGLLILPYPVGWLMALAGGVIALAAHSRSGSADLLARSAPSTGQRTGGRISNPDPRHKLHVPDRRGRMKHNVLYARPPAEGVPRFIALADPTAAPRTFVKLEHPLPALRVGEQPADAALCKLNRPLAPFIRLPLLRHLRQSPLSLGRVAPNVINEDHFFPMSFGHRLNRSHSRHGQEVKTGGAGPSPVSEEIGEQSDGRSKRRRTRTAGAPSQTTKAAEH